MIDPRIKIWDRFFKWKLKCEVIDFYQVMSKITWDIINEYVVAKVIDTEFNTNAFEVASSVVIRNQAK